MPIESWRNLVLVRSRTRPDSRARRQSSTADHVQYPIYDSSGAESSRLRNSRDILPAWQVHLRSPVRFRHALIRWQAHPATGIDRRFRECGVKRLSRRNDLDSSPDDSWIVFPPWRTRMRMRLTMGRTRWSRASRDRSEFLCAKFGAGNSVTDQRNRFVFSWMYEPRALNGGQGVDRKLTKGWKNSGVITAGSGRPVNATVIGDANQDGNSGQRPLAGSAQEFIRRPGLLKYRYADRAPSLSRGRDETGIHRRVIQPLQSPQQPLSTD